MTTGDAMHGFFGFLWNVTKALIIGWVAIMFLSILMRLWMR